MDQETFDLWMQMTGGDPEKMRAFAEAGLFPEQMAVAGRGYQAGLGMSQAPSAEGMRD